MSDEETVGSDQLSVSSDQGPAADGALGALKAAHAAEILALTEQVEALRDAVKERLSATGDASDDEQSDSRESQGGEDANQLGAFAKTAGVKESRSGSGRSLLRAAASQAQQSGSRVDVQEYLRLRRRYV